MTERAWFRVSEGIPEIGAYPPDLVRVDGDEVWIVKFVPAECCTPHTYMDRLTPYVPGTGTAHLTLMD